MDLCIRRPNRMKRIIPLSPILLCPVLLSCQGVTGSDYNKVHLDGLSKIASATEIESLLGDSDHFITHFGFAGETSNLWNTEVYFGGRYSLTMQVNIVVDYKNGVVEKVLDEPKFYLFTYGRIEQRANGNMAADISGQHIFGLADWERVYAADGDFSVIGLTLDRTPIPEFSHYVNAVRLPRVRLIRDGSNQPAKR